MSVVRAILGRFARFLVRIARTLDPGIAAAPYWVMPERMAALRARYPGAPEHWLELLARRTTLADGGPAPAYRPEREARAAHRGVWHDATPGDACPPGQRCIVVGTGVRGLVQADQQVRGNVKSLLYHGPTCRNYTCKNCTAVFGDAAQASAAGFRPAGDCLGGAARE